MGKRGSELDVRTTSVAGCFQKNIMELQLLHITAPRAAANLHINGPFRTREVLPRRIHLPWEQNHVYEIQQLLYALYRQPSRCCEAVESITEEIWYINNDRTFPASVH